jgi:RNA polymerase sigma-70 factor (ECF subfamily)
MNEDEADLIAQYCQRIRQGDREAWDALLDHYRSRMRRMVAVRMDGKLRGRVDASDIIQEAYLEANDRLEDYLANSKMPFHLWLRFLVGQRLLIAHRQHLGTAMRDVNREQGWPDSTSDGLADQLLAGGPTPSEDAAQTEVHAYLRKSLEEMDPVDREVLTLRHFEQLSNIEAAEVLNIEPGAASKRYLRALSRLQEMLARRPDLID